MDTSEGQARNFLCGILKVLWNRGWGRPGYEWLRMNDVGVDDCILSAADLLDTTEERLWTFLKPFARKSDFAISKRYSASE